MSFFKEIKDCLRFFNKKNSASRRLVFYSEKSIYFNYYEDYINSILAKSALPFSYITSDKNDLIFNRKEDRINVFYFKTILPFIFPFIDSRVLVMTMTNLNQSYIKRSKNSSTEFIYVFHAMMSTHLAYNKGAFDHYDTIFCVGPYQVNEIRKTEAVYHLKEKKLIPVGYPLLENMYRKVANSPKIQEQKTFPQVIIAPSWFAGNIFESCIYDIVDLLLAFDFEVVLRPHPEFLKRRSSIVESIKKQYKNQPKVIVEGDLNENKNILISDVLITDWSGIAFEYAWTLEKPVLFIDTVPKIVNPEHGRIDMAPLEVAIRKKIGIVLKPDEFSKIPATINELIANAAHFKNDLLAEREKNVFNWNTSANVGAEYILKALTENDKH